MKTRKQIDAKTKKADAAESEVAERKVRETADAIRRFGITTSIIPRARTSVGKISLASSQQTGPAPNEKNMTGKGET